MSVSPKEQFKSELKKMLDDEYTDAIKRQDYYFLHKKFAKKRRRR